MKPSQLFEGKNSSLYKTFMKTKKNTIKGVIGVPHPQEYFGKIKPIKAWAVINTDFNEPCVFVDEKFYTHGTAIFVSEIKGEAKKEAMDYYKNLTKEAKLKKLNWFYDPIKVIPVLITPITKVAKNKENKNI